MDCGPGRHYFFLKLDSLFFLSVNSGSGPKPGAADTAELQHPILKPREETFSTLTTHRLLSHGCDKSRVVPCSPQSPTAAAQLCGFETPHKAPPTRTSQRLWVAVVLQLAAGDLGILSELSSPPS